MSCSSLSLRPGGWCRREPRVLILAYAVIFSVLRPLLYWLDLGLRLLPLLIYLEWCQASQLQNWGQRLTINYKTEVKDWPSTTKLRSKTDHQLHNWGQRLTIKPFLNSSREMALSLLTSSDLKRSMSRRFCCFMYSNNTRIGSKEPRVLGPALIWIKMKSTIWRLQWRKNAYRQSLLLERETFIQCW